MKLEIDDIDYSFVSSVLLTAKLTHERLMTNPNVCEINRNRHREHAMMAQTAYDLLKKAKEEGAAK